MVRFTNREDFLHWVKNNINRRSVLRAFEEGTVEFLGGFTHIPPDPSPGWICKINSIHGRTWIFSVTKDGVIRYLAHVPWRYWVGGESYNQLYYGDNPTKYRKLRRQLHFEYNHKQRPTQDWAGHSCQEEINNGYVAKQRKRNSIFSRILRYFKW